MVSAHPAPRFPVYFPPEGHEKTDTPNHLAFFSIFGGFGVPNRPPGEGPRTTFSHPFPLRPPLGSPKGPWATKTDPRDAKTTPRRSQKAGLGVQKCRKSIQKPRKPCNPPKKNAASSPWVGHAQSYGSPLPQARWRICRRQLYMLSIGYTREPPRHSAR